MKLSDLPPSGQDAVKAIITYRLKSIEMSIEDAACQIMDRAMREIDALCPDRDRDFDFEKRSADLHQSLVALGKDLAFMRMGSPRHLFPLIDRMIGGIQLALQK